MEPSLKQILDALNSRFDEFDRHLDDRDRVFADHTGSVDSRFAALESSISTQAVRLERRLAGIESHLADPVPVSVEQRLASLEASLTDGHRITDLESGNDTTVKQEYGPRVSMLEKVSAELEAWRPGIDGVLDDIQKDVQKLVRNLDRQVFDESSHRPVTLPSPTAATESASAAGLHATSPSGHHVDMNPRDVGPGVVTTWTHIPANGASHQSIGHAEVVTPDV